VVAVLVLFLLPLVFFWPAATRQGVFFVGDISRLYYPQRTIYAAGLRQGQLPFWTPDALAGYPIFAEGETGALYPLNLLLYRLLPIDLALNYSIILNFVLAGWAMYAWARVLNLRPTAALLAAITFAASGFTVSRVNHLSIIAAIPWLPATLATVEMTLRSRNPFSRRKRFSGWLTWAILGSLALAFQFLAGHPQVSLMTVLAVLAYGVFRAWPGRHVGTGRGGDAETFSVSRLHRVPASLYLRAWLAGVGLVTGMVVLGGLLAAAQLVPTWELTSLSQRAGGLTGSFFTSFSWHPGLLITLFYPFPFGNPYPKVSIELATYLGILPLLLVGWAIWRRRGPRVWFFVGLALVALLLAFGEYNPAYRLLSRVPLFNLFRVPARFWYLTTLALATLAGIGADDLLNSAGKTTNDERRTTNISSWSFTVHRWSLYCLLLTAYCLLIIGLANLAPDANALVAAWRVLPGVWLLTSLALLWAAVSGRLTGRWLGLACLALVFSDLYTYGAVYGRTYNAVMDLPTFYARPKALDFLPADHSTYRVYTSEQIVPALSVQRESFYPNTGLVYDVPAAGGYFPLIPRPQLDFLTGMTARRLNLLDVRYFVIPQLLAVDEASEFYDVEDPFAPTLVGRSVTVPPTEAVAVEVTSYTSHSADWPQGSPVADVILTTSDGTTITLPLRAGIETAEWAYDRNDVRDSISHRQPPVARTWPAWSGFPPREHPGHSYLARFNLDRPVTVVSVRIQPHRPVAFVRVEDVEFVTAAGQRQSLNRLLVRPDHVLVYRSQDAVIYENRDALPRAFLVGRARRVNDDQALRLIDDPAFDLRTEVLLDAGEPLAGSIAPVGRAEITNYAARRISVAVEASDDAYLVLLDTDYPGWRATIDAQPVAIRRADYLFRAVRVPPGQHTVEFVYDPISLRLGVLISLLAGLAVLGGLMVDVWTNRW
jgi:hypothetical protein